MRRSLLVVLVGVTLVAGCGDDSDDTSEAESVLSSITATPTSAAPPPEPPAALAVGPAASGTTLTLVPGQRLVVGLPADPASGSVWGVERIDQSVLLQAGEPGYRPGAADGEPGISEWAFRAIGVGVTDLVLTYLTPGAQPDAATQRFELNVRVQRP